jgi:tripartite motif-containing protein 71
LLFFNLVPFFNQPKFCSTSVWNRKGITFANQITIGSNSLATFIDGNNSVYTINREKKQILVWREGNIDPAMIIPTHFDDSFSLFVVSNGDIYIDNGQSNGGVEKWISSTNKFVTVMKVYASCYGLFVDTNENVYCSISSHHQIIKGTWDGPYMKVGIVAGTGTNGSAMHELDRPHGIFVDGNFGLYVADCENDRVQLFKMGDSSGITVAGRESSSRTITLSCPTGILSDAYAYLFIVDSNNHRIVQSGPNGFHCVIGCYGSGYQSPQLFTPFSLSFDSFGNMFVMDSGNNRIQKFQYSKNSCGKFEQK